MDQIALAPERAIHESVTLRPIWLIHNPVRVGGDAGNLYCASTTPEE